MKPTIRIVTRGSNGELRSKDYEKHETVLRMHTQIGVDDCSTDATCEIAQRIARRAEPHTLICQSIGNTSSRTAAH